MASLRGVDAARLVLAGLDLRDCLFCGTVHLDQLRLEGVCTFNAAPLAAHWWRCRLYGSPRAVYWPRSPTGAPVSRGKCRAGTTAPGGRVHCS